ncbi:hypothetical protein ASPCAL02073 [Aspergillus calidoustus]|uniref:LEA domain protein n=1 Tax=Aspergillus calidoustus TaxID=454130 RepID=A0A0U5HEC2_ASPCI|nr:hypothetical protein ASPCAL02073 [Aspergillus calidoustus]
MSLLPAVPSLPEPNLTKPSEGLSLLQPLSRLGTGPGMIILTPNFPAETHLTIEDGVPSPLIKWAEESYTTVQIEEHALDTNAHDAIHNAVAAINGSSACEPKGSIGLVAYSANAYAKAADAVSSISDIKGVVVYTSVSDLEILPQASKRTIHHITGNYPRDKLARSMALTQHVYPTVESTFAIPFQPNFDYRTEAISHTRNLTHLKGCMDGPHFDLEKIWDEHTYYEFENRSVEHTMATMVGEPYVNHVPTLTGGIGREKLTDFYRHHFIFNNPDDTNLELISRTIGIDRVVDEFIFSFTHTKEVDWILPGLPPTNVPLRIPFMAVVNIRGDRLYHEHITWDQATVLRQLEILPNYLPFPYPTPSIAGEGARLECRVPVAGAEAAQKATNKNSVESNQMFEYRVRAKTE